MGLLDHCQELIAASFRWSQVKKRIRKMGHLSERRSSDGSSCAYNCNLLSTRSFHECVVYSRRPRLRCSSSSLMLRTKSAKACIRHRALANPLYNLQAAAPSLIV